MSALRSEGLSRDQIAAEKVEIERLRELHPGLTILRGSEIRQLNVTSADRHSWLRSIKGH